jgi:hypothetical protein
VSSSGLIYAAIVGAWAAYLVPMWLRRQDELNEARHTERFTTAIRILSRRGALERRYARMIADGEDGLPTSSFDTAAPDQHAPPPEPARHAEKAPPEQPARRRDASPAQAPRARQVNAPVDPTGRPGQAAGAFDRSRGTDAEAPRPRRTGDESARATSDARGADPDRGHQHPPRGSETARRNRHADEPEHRPGDTAADATPRRRGDAPEHRPTGAARRGHAEVDAAPPVTPAASRRLFGLRGGATEKPVKPPAPLARPDGRAKLLARRRRVVIGLFLLFTAGAVLSGLLGFAFLWLPLLPGAALTAYIGYLRVQERRRYEANLRSRLRPSPPRPAPPRPARRTDNSTPHEPRRRAGDGTPNTSRTGQSRTAERPPGPEARDARKPGRRESEERDHAAWIASLQSDADGDDRDAWDPVPVPLPTYVTAPVVPRGEPSAPAAPEPVDHPEADRQDPPQATAEPRRPAPAPTPLFDQYAEDPRRAHPYPGTSLPHPGGLYDQEWPRAGNE